MKKLTLSVGLLMGVMAMKAQDTTCTYFVGKRVIEFNYYTNEILYEKVHDSKYYEINITYGDVLCLDLSDEKSRTRKVITEFFDGSTAEQILDSKDNVYYSPRGATKVLVSKPRFFNLL
tara:strand:- start:408 stop:764 length:357 start_codon:yes stop_codon:yes gene_type:complete